MSRRPTTFQMQGAAIAFLGLASIGVSSACSGVGPQGQPVVFGDQTNIVIWDEAHQTEHFIRNANFRSGATDFGFIAPTPSEPELKEASNQAFYTLANLKPNGGLGGSGGFGGGMRLSNEPEVKVIQEADVAGFHATTLWSTDAHAINDWMNSHGYVSTPEVEEWADRYTSRGWYLTAFKVIDKSKLAASTGTVRMSFKTGKPYNPFFVPSSNILPNKKGTLRVYFVAVGDYDAKIGGTENWQAPQWTAAIPEATSVTLAKQVDIDAKSIPAKAQVETFVDTDFPRDADEDIYFIKKTPPPPAEVKTIPDIPVPILLPMFALGLVAMPRLRR